MKTKPPPDRRKFADDRDQIDYLYQKLLYWLYERDDFTRARIFADRLVQMLPTSSPGTEAIFPQECWSLICEARMDLPGAIRHRENEIRLIKRLHVASQSIPEKDLVMQMYGYAELSDRLDLLAVLYHDTGNLGKALGILDESKRLCKKHGIRFDGEDLIQEYLKEKAKSQVKHNRTGTYA
jgi:hypothetical protein